MSNDELVITIGSECTCTDSPEGQGAEPLSINLHLSFNNNLDRSITIENLELSTEQEKKHTLNWICLVEEKIAGILERGAGKAPFSIPARGSTDKIFHFEIPQHKGCLQQWSTDKHEISLFVTVGGWSKTLVLKKSLTLFLINTINTHGIVRVFKGELSNSSAKQVSKQEDVRGKSINKTKFSIISWWKALSEGWQLTIFGVLISVIGFAGHELLFAPWQERQKSEAEQNNKTIISFQKDPIKAGFGYFSVKTESPASIKNPRFTFGYLDLNLRQKSITPKLFNEIRTQEGELMLPVTFPTNHHLIVFAILQRDDDRIITSLSKVLTYDKKPLWTLENNLQNIDVRDRWYVKSELEPLGFSFGEPSTDVGTTSATVFTGKPLVEPKPIDGNGTSQPIIKKPN